MKDGKSGKVVKEGEWLTLDGSEGVVYVDQMPLVTPEFPKAYQTIMKWADGIRRLHVRTNADTPQDARKAIEFGAEGIGLVPHRAHVLHRLRISGEGPGTAAAIQEMILADDQEARVKALDKLAAIPAARLRRNFPGDGRPCR